MQTTNRPSFFMNTTTNQFSQQPYAYIFDQTYKTKLDKYKFQRNPKFAYYNTVVKMKNKLSNNQHQVYQLIFDPECNFENIQNKTKNYSIDHVKEKMNFTNLSWKNKNIKQNQSSTQLNGQQDHKIILPQPKRKSVRQINFQENTHKRRQSQIYYDKKPRLDDILAQYKRMNIMKQRQKKNNSFLIRQRNKKNQQFDLLKTGRLFTRNLSQASRTSKPHKN